MPGMGWFYVIATWVPIVLAWAVLWWHTERRAARRVELDRCKRRHPGFRASLAQAREEAL